jgi:integrase/recombinase XerC
MALFELMVGTGLRVSEVLALQREDVALNDRSGEVIVRAGKGGKQRSVPLTASVRRAVRAYLEDLPEMKPTDPLWQGQRGALTSPSGIFRLLKKYARQAGLAESLVSPHILRHTFASRYLAANPGDLRGLAAILGHSSLDTVMIYTEPTTQDLATRMELAETKTV